MAEHSHVSKDTRHASARVVPTAPPLATNGPADGLETALEVALDNAAPLLRHPTYLEQRRRNGQFAVGNTASVKHGQRAR
jgi:hypothetical protein